MKPLRVMGKCLALTLWSTKVVNPCVVDKGWWLSPDLARLGRKKVKEQKKIEKKRK